MATTPLRALKLRSTLLSSLRYQFLASILALTLVMSGCFGPTLPKCNASEALDLVGSWYTDSVINNPTAFGIWELNHLEVSRFRTIVEDDYQASPEVRSCRATLHFTVSGSVSTGALGLPEDGTHEMTDNVEYTIEWDDKAAGEFWLSYEVVR
ncbi:MAG: hypothetical protein U5K81_10340 [Trueperaceae bacterium]|nr:hypothetical protein [Trueperaceae bacterium]